MFLITGASGNVGRELTRLLLGQGSPVRVFTRDAARMTDLEGRAQIAVGEFANIASFRKALEGVDAVFLMGPRASAEIPPPLISEIATAGKPRVVFLSSIFAAVPESEIGQLHKTREDEILKAGLPATILRASGFMTNSLQWLASIQTESAVYNPMGDGRIAPIAPEDIAAVAVKALHNTPDTQGILPLTGDEMLTVPDQVRILGEVLRVPIRCIEISGEEGAERMVRFGVPAQIASALARSFQLVRQGHGAVQYDTVRRIKGRPALTFREWVQRHKDLFAPALVSLEARSA